MARVQSAPPSMAKRKGASRSTIPISARKRSPSPGRSAFNFAWFTARSIERTRLRPSGSTSALDAAVVDHYQRWKSAFVRHNCNSAWTQVLATDADHTYVAEAQGYGMVVVATMAGVDPDAKKDFDGFVKWKIDHPSSIDPDTSTYTVTPHVVAPAGRIAARPVMRAMPAALRT